MSAWESIPPCTRLKALWHWEILDLMPPPLIYITVQCACGGHPADPQMLPCLSRLAAAAGCVQGALMLLSSLSAQGFFVKQPVAFVPQRRINQFSMEKKKKKIKAYTTIVSRQIHWKYRSIWVESFVSPVIFWLCLHICICAYVLVLQNTMFLSKIIVSEITVRRWGCWRLEISFLEQRPEVMHAVDEVAVTEN